MLTGGRRLPVRFGTFHSVFFQILRLAYHYEVKDIATPALKYRFLEETLNETGYGVDDKKEFLSDIEKRNQPCKRGRNRNRLLFFLGVFC